MRDSDFPTIWHRDLEFVRWTIFLCETMLKWGVQRFSDGVDIREHLKDARAMEIKLELAIEKWKK